MMQTETSDLLVATDLSHFELPAGQAPTHGDVVRDGRAYRRLDGTYFSWLHRSMLGARAAAATGQISVDAFDELTDRYNEVYFWAVCRHGRGALTNALRAPDRQYRPPAAATATPARGKPTSPATGPAVPTTTISGAWAAGAGTLLLTGTDYSFRPWVPSLGRVYWRGFAFDSETTLIVGHETPDYVLGAVFGDTGQGYFLTPDVVEPFFRMHNDLQMVMHHAAFDLAVLDRLAPGLKVYDWVDANRVWDTRLPHRGYRLGTHGDTAFGRGQSTLEACAREYLGYDIPKDVRDRAGNDVRTSYARWFGRSLAEIEDVCFTYLATDAVVTRQVFRQVYDRLVRKLRSAGAVWGFISQEWLDDCLQRWGPQTHHLRLKAEIVLRQVTARGVRVAPTQRDLARANVQELIDEKLKVMADDYNFRPGGQATVCNGVGEVTLGAGKRLQQIIGELDTQAGGLGLERTAMGQYRATSEVVEGLAAYSPFFAHLHEYKVAAKLMSTYLDKMGEGEAALHPGYDVLKATGRTSSFGDINAQNLPRKDPRIRRCFVPRSDNVFLDFDYKAIELATLSQAILSQFKWTSKMADAINAGQDLHRRLAASIFQLAEAEVSDDQRSAAKPANFGLPGGMSAAIFRAYLLTSVRQDGKLTADQKKSLEDWATPENCQQAVEAWFATWPEMRDFLEKDDGLPEDVAAYFELTPEHYHLFTGRPVRGGGYREPAAWLGGMFLKAVKHESPSTAQGVTYAADQLAFFWTMLRRKLDLLPEKARKLTRGRKGSRALFQAVRNHVSRSSVFCLTGRLRAGATFCSRHNMVFQGLASDGACLALWAVWRSGYTISNFVHDQLVVEVPAEQDLRPHIDRVTTLMVEAMRQVVPDVRIDVDAVVTRSWAKKDEVKLDAAGYPILSP